MFSVYTKGKLVGLTIFIMSCISFMKVHFFTLHALVNTYRLFEKFKDPLATTRLKYYIYTIRGKTIFFNQFLSFSPRSRCIRIYIFFNIIVNHESHFTVKSIAGYCYYCIIFHFDVRVEVENYILYLLLQLNTIRTINVASRNRNLCNFNIGISRTEKI